MTGVSSTSPIPGYAADDSQPITGCGDTLVTINITRINRWHTLLLKGTAARDPCRRVHCTCLAGGSRLPHAFYTQKKHTWPGAAAAIRVLYVYDVPTGMH